MSLSFFLTRSHRPRWERRSGHGQLMGIYMDSVCPVCVPAVTAGTIGRVASLLFMMQIVLHKRRGTYTLKLFRDEAIVVGNDDVTLGI